MKGDLELSPIRSSGRPQHWAPLKRSLVAWAMSHRASDPQFPSLKWSRDTGVMKMKLDHSREDAKQD